MYCPNCGNEITGSPAFCPDCGAKLSNSSVQQPVINNQVHVSVNFSDAFISPKSKGVALLLCIFGGGMGLHHFYVGNFGKGILYCFTMGLFTIGWFIDIIKILTNSFRDRDGRRLA